MNVRIGTIAALGVAIFCAGSLVAHAANDESKLLPAGEGTELIANSCQICHSLTLVTSQRLSEKQWLGELVKMEKWGAPLRTSDNEKVAAYLGRVFGPNVPEPRDKMVKSPNTPG